MKKEKTRRSKGIWVRGYVPMLFLISALCIVTYVYIRSSNMSQQLKDNSNQTMQRILQDRSDYLSTSMTHKWTEMTAAIQAVNAIYDKFVLDKGYTIENIVSQEDLYIEFLNAAINPAVDVLRRNMVSGVYIVLADEHSVSSSDTLTLPGFFLRDRDSTSIYNDTNKDLLFERAPVAVVQNSGITTDSFWVPSFSISDEGDLADAFFKPYNAALKNPTADSFSLSYWSTDSTIINAQTESFFFSTPLISNSGEVFGIIGIDIIKSYFAESVPHQELSNISGAYALYKEGEDGSLTFIDSFSKTGKYVDEFWQGINITPTSAFETLTYEYGATYNVQMSKFKIYDADSPFANEGWYLCAVSPHDVLYKTTSQTMNSVSLLVLLLAVATVVGVGTIIYQIASPIKHLEQQVKSSQLDCDELNLDPTGISELDLLADAVEKLNKDVRDTAGKFSQILEMSSMNLGAFEFNKLTKHWFISRNFFRAFGGFCDDVPLEALTLESTLEKLQAFKATAIDETIVNIGEDFEYVCEIPNENNLPNFVRIKIKTTEEFIRGFVEDVSIEWREIRKLAYERNHDNLTDIYNRRGFYEKYYSLMDLPPQQLKTSAVIMLDLDNLKLLNDTYGHDIGDRYIKATAKVLKKHSSDQVIVSRISGDEFLVFTHGYNNKNKCNSFLKKLESALALEKISIGNDNTYSLHVSAGVAYYPSDSTEKNQLIQFADFAMYQGKRNVKGRFTNFNRAVYDKEELRIKRKEALNKIIEGNAIDYFFQPIICAKTGIVFAYEALMRPQNDLLRSPLDVLNVAKEENRLIDIETMTMFSATKSFIHWCESGVITNPQCKLFVNSITSVILSEEQLAYYESDYSNYLSRLVVEYTEEEKAIGELLSLKQNILKKWGGQIALDDYGSGYNGETMLLETDVQYIKVDINMIKNIHISDNRKQRVMDLLNYAHSRGILVVAEGIESKEEFNALQELGVDFLQGYYFAKPALVPPTPNLENLFAPKEVGKTI